MVGKIVPEHWSVVSLRRLTTCLDGKRVPLDATKRGGMAGSFSYWGANRIIDRINQFIFDEDLILLGEDGAPFFEPTRPVAFFSQGKIWPNNHIHVLRASGLHSARFLVYALNCVDYTEYVEGATRDKLTQSSMNRIPVPVPPETEQNAIVNYLDQVDRRIDGFIHAKQKLLQLLEEQKQAIIHQAVMGQIDIRTRKPYPVYKPSGVEWLGDVPEHWEVRRLRTVVDMRVSNVDKHVKDGEKPVRLCNYVDVYYNDRINKRMDFMHATATNEEIERFRLERDDVLITKDSETWDDIGVPALVTAPACDLISGYHLALLRPRPDKLAGAFLLRALQSKGLAYQFHVEAKGVTRYGLSHAGITSVWLPLPSLSEQTVIVHYLDEVSANIETALARMRRQIELFQEYRTRLIADVVTGKLDVREAAANLPDDTESMDAMDDPPQTSSINDVVSQVAG